MFLDLSLFKRNRNFRQLYLAQVISGFGSQMTMVAMPYQIYQLTQSTLMTGLIGTVELVALTATVLYGGVLSDRYNRKKIIVLCESLMILCVLLLAGNALLPEPNLFVIFVLAALLSGLNGLHRPAIEAMIPSLVDQEDYVIVSSLAPMRHITTMIVGPSIAGLILAQMGAAWTYLVDASTFLLSILFLLGVKQPVRKVVEEIKEMGFFQEVIEGMLYLKNRKDILGTYLIDFIAMVLVSPQVLMPHIAHTLSADAMVGVFYGITSVGSLLAGAMSGWTKHVRRHGMSIAICAGLWALSVGAIGLAKSLPLILVCLFLSGAFDMVSGIFRMTMWNTTIPASMRGRMASFEMLGYMSGPLLGQLYIGATADFLGYQKALLLGGGLACGLICIACICLPEFTHYRSKD